MRRESIFFLILFVVVFAGALAIARPFLSYIVLAGILTYTLFPVYQFLLDRTHRPELSSALSIVIALLLMILPAVYLVTQLVNQVSGAYTNFQSEGIYRISDYLSGLTGNRLGVDFQEMMDSISTEVRRSIVGLAPNLLGSVTEVLLGMFIMFFVMFYGFREGKGFLSHIKKILPLDPQLNDSLFHELRTVTQAVLYGQVMTAIIQGALGGIGLLIFGVSNWLFWGSIMIITALLPVLGTPIIWVPAAVGLILNGDTSRGVGLLIFGATLVMNIDNFIRPRLVSGRTTVHPVLILVGVLGGLKIFGFIGMLVGPLVLALLVALIKFYEQNYLRRPRPVPAATE
jgi:predicted PurR-regulated permease PerM